MRTSAWTQYILSQATVRDIWALALCLSVSYVHTALIVSYVPSQRLPILHTGSRGTQQASSVLCSWKNCDLNSSNSASAHTRNCVPHPVSHSSAPPSGSSSSWWQILRNMETLSPETPHPRGWDVVARPPRREVMPPPVSSWLRH